MLLNDSNIPWMFSKRTVVWTIEKKEIFRAYRVCCDLRWWWWCAWFDVDLSWWWPWLDAELRWWRSCLNLQCWCYAASITDNDRLSMLLLLCPSLIVHTSFSILSDCDYSSSNVPFIFPVLLGWFNNFYNIVTFTKYFWLTCYLSRRIMWYIDKIYGTNYFKNKERSRTHGLCL